MRRTYATNSSRCRSSRPCPCAMRVRLLPTTAAAAEAAAIVAIAAITTGAAADTPDALFTSLKKPAGGTPSLRPFFSLADDRFFVVQASWCRPVRRRSAEVPAVGSALRPSQPPPAPDWQVYPPAGKSAETAWESMRHGKGRSSGKASWARDRSAPCAPCPAAAGMRL